MARLLIEWASLEDPSSELLIRTWASEADVARASQFRSPLRKEQSLLARALLRRILASSGFVQEATLQLAFEESGRPQLTCASGARLWVSLAHSGNLAIAAISDLGPLGVDIEDATKPRNFAAMRQYLLPGENNPLPSERDPAVDFYSLWTIWEALTKGGNGDQIRSIVPSLMPPTSLMEKVVLHQHGETHYVLGTHQIAHYVVGLAIGPIQQQDMSTFVWPAIFRKAASG